MCADTTVHQDEQTSSTATEHSTSGTSKSDDESQGSQSDSEDEMCFSEIVRYRAKKRAWLRQWIEHSRESYAKTGTFPSFKDFKAELSKLG